MNQKQLSLFMLYIIIAIIAVLLGYLISLNHQILDLLDIQGLYFEYYSSKQIENQSYEPATVICNESDCEYDFSNFRSGLLFSIPIVVLTFYANYTSFYQIVNQPTPVQSRKLVNTHKSYYVCMIIFILSTSVACFSRGLINKVLGGDWYFGWTNISYKMASDLYLMLHALPVILFCLVSCFTARALYYNQLSKHRKLGYISLIQGIIGFTVAMYNMIIHNGAPMYWGIKFSFILGIPVSLTTMLLAIYFAKTEDYLMHADCLYYPICMAFGAAGHRWCSLFFQIFLVDSNCHKILGENGIYSCWLPLGICASWFLSIIHYFGVIRHHCTWRTWRLFALYSSLYAGATIMNVTLNWGIIFYPNESCRMFEKYGDWTAYKWNDGIIHKY